MVAKIVSVPVALNDDADFKEVYRKFGGKIQKNVPLTEALFVIVEDQGGADYLLKLLLRDLQGKKKLPKGYDILLEFD